jgi:glucosyl-dolichyl phosphate glucuronosyltransferase
MTRATAGCLMRSSPVESDPPPPQPFESYEVSIVVPTHNRHTLLGRTLETLIRQRSDSVRYEIIVVDNNSTDETRVLVETFARGWPHVRYFFEARPGVSHARNTGIAAARAPLIAFIDDDVEADPTWVATIKRSFDDHPDIDCLGGKIHARWAAPPPRWLTRKHWGAVALQADKSNTPYIDADHASPCLMTANFASRRAALDDVGGFSPDYMRDEDRELQLRLWAAGKRGLYVGAMAVTTEVPRERMTKAYHRQFHLRVGGTHARMRYRDQLDREGRLAPETMKPVMLCGAPGYLYGSLLHHVKRWLWRVVRLDWNQAFYHETRALYFGSYIWHRYRQQGSAAWAVPWQFVQFTWAVARSRIRGRALRV